MRVYHKPVEIDARVINPFQIRTEGNRVVLQRCIQRNYILKSNSVILVRSQYVLVHVHYNTYLYSRDTP